MKWESLSKRIKSENEVNYALKLDRELSNQRKTLSLSSRPYKLVKQYFCCIETVLKQIKLLRSNIQMKLYLIVSKRKKNMNGNEL